MRVVHGLTLAFGLSAIIGLVWVMTAEDGRWYSPSQVSSGEVIFTAHCASCHGASAQGTTAWRKRDVKGNLPPPPLNGAAHAWHHPTSVLLRTIDLGGVPLGGTMPAFGEVLSQDQKLAVIAYFQSFWQDEVYQGWFERGGLN